MYEGNDPRTSDRIRVALVGADAPHGMALLSILRQGEVECVGRYSSLAEAARGLAGRSADIVLVDLRSNTLSTSRGIRATRLPPGASSPPLTVPPLTARERVLLRLVASGRSYQMAADELGISINTVRNHIRRMYEKLDVHSGGEAVARALRQGLI